MQRDKLGKAAKDAWLIVGITMVLLCLLEGGLSVAFLIKERFSGPDFSRVDYRATADTYPKSPWVKDYYKEFDEVRSNLLQWKSYVYWRRHPYRGEHINIDTDGIRVTVAEPKPQASSRTVSIFMFGGSTLWGEGARDAFTIPSLLARELQGSGVASQITNFGESGYVSTQGVIALILQLQKRRIPDLVIFYDGFNDTYSAYQQSVAGLPQNEYNRDREFNLTHAKRTKLRRDLVLQDMVSNLSTVKFLDGLLRRAGFRNETGAGGSDLHRDNQASNNEALAREVVETYWSNIEVVKALSEQYGFTYLFYWQPTIFQKTYLTPYERLEREKIIEIEQFLQSTYDFVRQRGLAPPTENPFHDLSRVFSEVREPVYIDGFHLGESGNHLIAKNMVSGVLCAIAACKGAATHPGTRR